MQDLVSGVSAEIEFIDLLLGLFAGVACAGLLSFVVRRYSRILGDRSQYTLIYMTLIPVMVLIISVVKSSLALSLGLVGALSIVRFRTPIKEPEELVYLFIAISVGLGLGAGQFLPTIVAFVFIMLIVIVLGRVRTIKRAEQDVFVELHGQHRPGQAGIQSMTGALDELGVVFDLRRYHEQEGSMSATFRIGADSPQQLDKIIESLKSSVDMPSVTVIDRSRSLN